MKQMKYLHLNNSKKKLTQKINNLRPLDQSLFLTQLINFATRQINSGNDHFYKEVLDLYRLGLNHHLVITNQRIGEVAFGNILLSAFHAREFEWAKTFMEEYQKYLDETIRADAVALNQGLWHFHKEEFEEAYLQFLNYSFSNAYQPKARLNIIRTLFEQFLQDETLSDLLIAQIEAFEKFLHRNTLMPSSLKEADFNTIQLIKRMTTGITQRKNKSKLKKALLDQMNRKKRMVAKNWLIKKVNELKP